MPKHTTDWNIEFKIHGAIKLAEGLHRSSTHALKHATELNEVYTRIMLREAPNSQHIRTGYFSVFFDVKSETQSDAIDAGTVYASQLCDLLSFITRVGTEHEVDEESRAAQYRKSRYATTADRILREHEWQWIICNLPHLHLREPRFMAACSWYRRGLGTDEITEKLCCLWRVIERCAMSYADKTPLTENDRGRTKAVISIFRDQFFDSPPNLLSDEARSSNAYEFRNNISHGNVPLSPKLIEGCSELMVDLEDAAYKVLKAVSAKLEMRHSLKPL